MRLWSNSSVGGTLQRLRAMPRAIAWWIAVGIMVVIGIGLYQNLVAVAEIATSRTRLGNLIGSINELLTTVLDAETGQRGYLLTGNEAYLEPWTTASKVIDSKMERVVGLSAIVPHQQPQVEALRKVVAIKVAELKESTDVMRSKGLEAALTIVRSDDGKEATEEIRGLVAEIRQAVKARFVSYERQAASLSRWLIAWVTLGSISAAGVLALMLLDRRHEVESRKSLEGALPPDPFAELTSAQAHSATDAIADGVEPEPSHSTGIEHTLAESEREVAALGEQALESANFLEAANIRTQNQSDGKIAAMGQQARELARSVESSRIQTLNQSDKAIKELKQRARDLATSVETSRIQTLVQSDKEIENLGQQARDLATSVETARIQTLNQSDKEIEALGQLARELARSVETSRIQTLMQSDKEIEALGQQARDLATSVEVLRLATLDQSDKEIEALGQQARDLATTVEKSRIQTLNQSNKEIRKLNEELEQRVLERTAQLEVANKELESFSYSVSHDLRAPLRAIDGFSRILLKDYCEALSSEGKEYLQMVRDNTRQMGQLVDDLLAFSRLGRQELAKHVVDPNAIVRRCLAELTKEQEGRQLEIVIGDLPSCQADPTLLKQAWTNLISNALKYTRKQETARIEIGCSTEPRAVVEGQPPAPDGSEQEVIYFVKDNGAGFDMKYVNKLFGVFQRLHRSTEYEGTGVGLAIVQRIVQRHGGRVWGDAVPQQGATFSFTLN